MGEFTKRNSNFELMRIVCMFALICHHYVVHGGFLDPQNSSNRIVVLACLSIGKICFIAFLAVSSYFLADKPFKAERFVKIWLQVFFYSILFTGITQLLTGQITWRNAVSSLFPIIGNSHGFAAAYLAFYLVIPFLQKAIKEATRKQLLFLISILIYFQIISKGMGFIAQYQQYLYSELQLFILIYIIVVYLKRFPLPRLDSKLGGIALFAISWATMWGIYILNERYPNPYIQFFFSINADESGIMYILGGIGLMMFFKNLSIKPHTTINYVASTTFGILLIHDHNFFRYPLWSKILHVQDGFGKGYFLFRMLIICLMVFITAMMIDICRINLLEKIILQTRWYRHTCEWINKKVLD